MDALRTARLVKVSLLGLLLLFLFEHSLPNMKETPLDDVQRTALSRMLRAHELLVEQRERVVDEAVLRELRRTDTGDSGLIGVEWSHLVTTTGSLEAKLLSTDPRWVILMMEWYRRADVGAGSRVAIGSSGSFPGLLLSARIAAETLGARPLIVGSLTSSNYGATIPEFDLHHQEEALLRAGIISHAMVLLSPGGDEDAMAGLEKEAKDLIRERLANIQEQSPHTQVISPGSLRESIDTRTAHLLDDVSIFVNLGGHAANYGVGISALALPSGYIDPADHAWHGSGDSVALRALGRNIPVINLINLRGLAMEHAALFADQPNELMLMAQREWPTGHRVTGAALAVALLVACVVLAEKKSTPGLTTQSGGAPNA